MQGFPASLYSKPTDRRRPAERPVVLVTDRPNPKSAISDALQVIAAVEVVGPDETWDRPGAIAGVVCDLTLARPQAAHCLRRLQARYAGVEPPLLCLLRQVTSGAVLEAKALGAAACLSVDAPPRNIVQALFKIIYPTESIADRLIQASRSGPGRSWAPSSVPRTKGSRRRWRSSNLHSIRFWTPRRRAASAAGLIGQGL